MSADIEQWLLALQNGDAQAGDRLFALLYEEFKSKAHLVLRGGRQQTLSTTELVNETWLKLRGQFQTATTRLHYCRLAAMAMRQVLVDRARQRNAEKRGSGSVVLSLQESAWDVPIEESPADLLLLDQVMQALSKIDVELGELAQLHLFGGLSIGEIASLWQINERTAFRKWRTARVALMQLMADPA